MIIQAQNVNIYAIAQKFFCFDFLPKMQKISLNKKNIANEQSMVTLSVTVLIEIVDSVSQNLPSKKENLLSRNYSLEYFRAT